jgi:hypothetical protein
MYHQRIISSYVALKDHVSSKFTTSVSFSNIRDDDGRCTRMVEQEQCGLGTRRHPGGGIGGPQRRMPRRGAVAGACGRAAPAQIWPWRPGWAHESCGGSWWWWGNCSLLLPSICCMLQQIHRSHQAAAQFNPSRARIEKQQ